MTSLNSLVSRVVLTLIVVVLHDCTFADEPEGQDRSAKPAAASTEKHSEEHGASDGSTEALQANYGKELNRLRDLSAGSIDPCLNAMYVAARDARVRALFIRKLLNPDYVFKGIRCLEGPSIPEQKLVLFDFDCRPEILCFIDPNFLVVVDVVNGRVVSIIDPYLGGPVRSPHASHRAFEDAATVEIAAIGSNYKFEINGEENPTITVRLGDTVKVSLTSSGGTHDWKLVYLVNGSEVDWAHTPSVGTGGNPVSVEFTADRVGEFDYFCSRGQHRQLGMRGKFVVTE